MRFLGGQDGRLEAPIIWLCEREESAKIGETRLWWEKRQSFGDHGRGGSIVEKQWETENSEKSSKHFKALSQIHRDGLYDLGERLAILAARLSHTSHNP
jgi:hypothetical protein